MTTSLKRKTQGAIVEGHWPLQKHKIHGETWELSSRYELLHPLGEGSFGMVYAVRDKETNQVLAVKRIHDAFDALQDARCLWSEIRAMTWFKHPHLLSLIRMDAPHTSHAEWDNVYMYMPIMITDAFHQLARVQEKSAPPWKLEHVREWMVHLLSAIVYMHKAGVWHRDMSATNIMFDSSGGTLKVGDFGIVRNSTRPIGPIPTDEEKPSTTKNGDPMPLSGYITQSWYRAPEVMLKMCKYNEKIDCWAIGCIFAEWLNGSVTDPAWDKWKQPIFVMEPHMMKDDTTSDQRLVWQLTQIFQWLDRPAADEFKKHCDEKLFQAFVEYKILKSMDARPATYNMKTHFSFAGADAVDLLTKLLALDPNVRISASDALAHPFLKGITLPESKPPIGAFDLHTEKEWAESTPEQWKSWICTDFAEFMK